MTEGDQRTTGGHPSAKKLQSLVSGELERPEAQVLVRHLLTGCPRCAQITARLWDLETPRARRADATLQETIGPSEKDKTMTEAEAAAQGELLSLAAELENIRQKALALCESLPVPANEDLMLLGEADMNVSTEVRSVLRCVVHDMIEPAVRSLQGAADYVPEAERKECLFTSS